MNVDHILETLNGHQVVYLLIGGMNFLLRHTPVLTYDVDVITVNRLAHRSDGEVVGEY